MKFNLINLSLSSLAFCVLALQLASGIIARNAVCTINANSGVGGVFGNITLFQQEDGPVQLSISLDGLDRSDQGSMHGFHVHRSGNLSSNCLACLEHFNPTESVHGGINDTQRHVGDLGNINTFPNGTVAMNIMDSKISLNPASPNNVVGRSLVVHASPDDLGKGNSSFSNTTGNSGPRLGCCTIVLRSSSSSSTLSVALLLMLVLVTELFM